MKRNTIVFWLVLAVGLVLVALAAGAPPNDGKPLDPRATGPLGAKALVLTLGELGGDVQITPTVTGFDTAVLLRDDLTADQRDAVDDWVTRGGTLLVADPSSSLHPGHIVGDTQTIFGEATVPRGECSILPLEQLSRVDPTGGVLYDSGGAAQACFTRGAGAFVVAQPQGDGWIVATGGAGAFVNDRLDSEDNAALAANILVPTDGTRVAFLERANPGTGEGDKTLADLIPTGVRLALGQLLIAFAVFALWRARRLGRPVTEVPPVQIAASELVVAVGNLLQKSGRPEAAAERLRADLHRELVGRLGLSPSASAEVVADLASQRTGVDRDKVARALAGPSPTTPDSLVAMTREVEEVRTAILGSRA
jgi:hypothetical protein